MKKTLTNLIVTAALMMISAVAMAQGGDSPFVGSTHGYKVNPGAPGNGFLWEITGGDAADYVVNSLDLTSDSINITWKNSALGKSFTLSFTETTPAPANCATVQQLTITPTANTFDVSVSEPAATCNNATDTATPSANTTNVTFVVSMATGSTWNPDWEIVFSLSNGGADSFGSVSATNGNLTGAGPYTLTNISGSSVDITVPVNGDAFTLLEPVFTIISAKELQYNTPDTDDTDWGATATINPIPNTSAIITD